MSDDQKIPPVGDDEKSSADSVDNGQQSIEKDDVITMKKSTYEKLLKEKKNVSAENQTLRQKMNAEIEEKLKEQQQWKQIAELREKEVSELKENLSLKEKKEKDSMKLSSLKKELKKLGMDERYLDSDLVTSRLDAVQIDSETNLTAGADLIANQIKNAYAPLFGQSIAGVDSSAPDTSTGSLSYDEWLKLPLAEQRKRMKDVRS